jgi:hypothetical protein
MTGAAIISTAVPVREIELPLVKRTSLDICAAFSEPVDL